MPPKQTLTQDSPAQDSLAPESPPTPEHPHNPKATHASSPKRWFASGSSKFSMPKNISRKHLLVFALVFGVLGTYFIFNSFAATPPSVNKEAEQLTLPPTGATVTSDSTASATKAIKFTARASATGPIDLPYKIVSLTVRAKGDQCGGAPNLIVKGIKPDGTIAQLQTANVSSTSWADYPQTGLNIPTGTYTSISVEFTNPTTQTKGGSGKLRCQSNLYVDKLTFYGEETTSTTPAPTVNLSANPTTVSSGATSTLTWSSTNATNCTASGSWTGTKPVSGTETTAAITANATYSLSCTGAGGTANQSVGVTVSAPPSTISCTGTGVKTLSPGGNLQTFVDSLDATSNIGCLHGGTYSYSGLRFNKSGTLDKPITLMSYTGERAKLVGGAIYVPSGSNYVTLDSLDIDGRSAGAASISIQLFGDYNKLLNSDVTNSHLSGSCITLSDYGGAYPIIKGAEVRGNHIHGCGLVSNGAHDHGIYVANSDGHIVSDNVFEDIWAGWGIQLWTTSLNGLFERNTIRASSTTSSATEGGLVIVAGSGTHANTFRNNKLISIGRSYVVDTYAAASDAARFSGNCIVSNGASLWESSWLDAGSNRVVASETAC